MVFFEEARRSGSVSIVAIGIGKSGAIGTQATAEKVSGVEMQRFESRSQLDFFDSLFGSKPASTAELVSDRIWMSQQATQERTYRVLELL